MCGIAGIFTPSKMQREESSELLSVIEQLKHRGPDHQGTIAINEVQLAHSRLSIIDINERGHQPMPYANKRYWISFNGEIYNYLEIKTELIKYGLNFQTNTDTEVILAAWAKWGTAALEKLTGMFAFALWDDVDKTLFLARDRFGEKPLYYAPFKNKSLKDGLVFASELSALINFTSIGKKINSDALSDFFSLNYILTHNCIIEGVKKLPPAHYLTIKKGYEPTVKCYWSLKDCFINKKYEHSSLDDSIGQWNEMFHATIKKQMRSDVKLGAFLSGGLDSSTIVAAMRKTNSNKPHAFTIDFKEKSYSELAYSQQVAKALAIPLDYEVISGNNIDDTLAAIKSYDEPFADASAIACYQLARFAKKKTTVCLTGDAGDELFAGYETYTADKLRNMLAFLPKPLTNLLNLGVNKIITASHKKVSFDYKLKQFLHGAKLNYRDAHYSWREIFTADQKMQLCQHSSLHNTAYHPIKTFRSLYQEVENCHPLDQSIYVDMKTWMIDDILVKVDRANMAHSLETRAPFLDHKLVELAVSLPPSWKLHGLTKKYFLKKSQETKLPKNIIYRKKAGFNVPVSQWLNGPLKEKAQMILNHELKELCNGKYIQQLWQEHSQKKQDHGYKLYGLFCLGLWIEKHRKKISM